MKLKIYDLKCAKRDLPCYAVDSNKSDHGRVLIIAGSRRYPGAGILSASSAARVGAGYVTLGNFDQSYHHWLQSPEFLVQMLDTLNQKAIKNFDVIALGPGLGSDEKSLRQIEAFVRQLIKWKVKNVVLDADGLNCIAHFQIYPLPRTWILTPHAREMERLLVSENSTQKGPTVKDINKNREKYVKKTAKKFGCWCLLKGPGILLTHSDHDVTWRISSGNEALSKAGTGDVLTGMIAGLLAQGLTSEKSTLLGAYLHGELADQWVKCRRDPISMMPSDLRDLLPTLIHELRPR